MRLKEITPGNLITECEHCGLPSAKTSEDVGMDCVNDCARKEYEKYVANGGLTIEQLLDKLEEF